MAITAVRHRIGAWIAGILIAATGSVVTVLLVQHQRDGSMASARERFALEVRSSTDATARRMEAIAGVVAGLRNMFLIDPELDYRQFERVTSEYLIRENYPEIPNLTFARRVGAADLPEFRQRMQAQAQAKGRQTDNLIHPPLAQPDHYIIEFIWPWQGNENIWGLDIASQPDNLAGLLLARDLGRPVLSAPFDMLQAEVDRRMVMLRFPVFAGRDGEAGDKGAFLGTVAASVRISTLLDGIAAAGYFKDVALLMEDLGLADSAESRTPSLLGRHGPEFSPQQIRQGWHEQRTIQIRNRLWRLTFAPAGDLLSASEQQLLWWIGSTGSALTLLLAFLGGLIVRQRADALGKADISRAGMKKNEQQLSAVFNQAAVGVVVVETHTGNFVRVNRRFCEMAGYDEAELMQGNISLVCHPEDNEKNTELLQVMTTGHLSDRHMEKRIVRKDGSIVWADLAVSLILQPDGTSRHHVTIIQDITDRRAMQEALHLTEQRLRSVLDGLPIGVVLLQGIDLPVYYNRSFTQITGYTFDDVQRVALWWELVYPDPAEREAARIGWEALIASARQFGTVIHAGEFRILCKDGKQRSVNISGVELGENMLVMFEDLSGRKAAEEEASYLAFHDPLTGLPNRRQLLKQLQSCMVDSARSQTSGALLMLDVDHFKTINETRGHDRGDQLLLQVAERLRATAREDQFVARHGDDEFVILIDRLGGTPDAVIELVQQQAMRMQAALRMPYVLDGEPFHTTVSMGATIFAGLGEKIEDLLKRADLAMHQAKAAGRNTLQFYDPRLQARVQARASLEQDMRLALEQGQFELYFQPQIDRGRITGCESLLRWHHPREGFVSPATFIPLAEESGLIVSLGEWVLHSACRQLARWAQNPALAHLTLAVNVSPRQFHQKDFVTQTLATIASSGANAGGLKLELTESLLLQDVEDTIGKMGLLKSYGVSFALDDFGTGYSSLAYLKRLPLDQLKIDQSFVRDVLTDPNDAAIARTIVALGTSLGLHVIAEGVETEAQREFLVRNQCHAWQGYLLSKPLPLPEFEIMVQAHGPDRLS